MATSTENSPEGSRGAIQGQNSDGGRDVKLTLTLIAAAVVIVVGGGYWIWGWVNTPPPAVSRIDLSKVANASTGSAEETPAYKALLSQSNQQGAEEARSSNRSFIASMPLAVEPVKLPAATAKPKVEPQPHTPRESRNTVSQSTGGGDSQKNDKNSPLQQLIGRIKESKPPSGIQEGIALYAGEAGGADGSEGRRWGDTLPGGARQQNTSYSRTAEGSSAGVVPIEVVAPYWRGPGVIETGIDSDNSITPVLASLPTGRYAGAVLKAPGGAKLSGDGVVIHFTAMAYNGINYNVDAYALNEESLRANVSTEVNNRYMSRIVLPAVLSGIGSVGGMYSQANTQLVTNGFNTQTVRPGLPDGEAVAGAIVGGGASQAAKVLSEDASRVPAKQVTVTRGQVVAIQFMRGVYSGDAITPGQHGEAVRPAITPPAPRNVPANQPISQEQWRLQAQERIRAQGQLQEVGYE